MIRNLVVFLALTGMGLTLAPKAEAARCYKFRGEGYWLSKDGGMTRTQGLNTRSLDRVGIAGGWTSRRRATSRSP